MIIRLGKFHSHLKGLIYVLFVLEKAIQQIYGHSGLSVWSLHFVPGPVWVPSGHSINLPQPKHMHARLICDSELGVNVKVNACLSQLALQQTVDLSKLYPCFVTAGIGSTPTTTLNWISERKWMDIKCLKAFQSKNKATLRCYSR